MERTIIKSDSIASEKSLLHIPLWVVFLFFIFMAIILTWPALPKLFTHIIGYELLDNWPHVWNFYWPETLIKAQSMGYRSSGVFFPDYLNLLITFGDMGNEILWFPVSAILGPVAGFNLYMLCAVILSGFFIFLLARELGASDAGALFAGIVFGCSPYLFSEMFDGRIEGIAVALLPLFVWFLIKLLRTGRVFWYFLAALSFISFAMCNFYHGLIGLLFAGYYLAAIVIQASPLERLQIIKRTFILGVMIAIPMLPVALSYSQNAPSEKQIQASGVVSHPEFQPGSPPPGALDPTQFFRLKARPILGSNMGNIFVIGITPLLLAFCTLILKERRAVIWLIGAAVFIIFSMGSFMVIGDLTIPMPFFFLQLLPLFSRLHMVYRFGLIVIFCIAIAAALCLTAITTRFNLQKKFQIVLLFCVCLATLFEYIILSPVPFPLPFADAYIPKPYKTLREADTGAALILPHYTTVNINGRYLYYQTFHHKPLVNGAVSIIIPGQKYFDFFNKHKLLQLLLKAQKENIETIPNRQFLEESIQILIAEGLRFYVVHNCLLSDERRLQLHHILSAAIGSPVAAEDNVVVYDAFSKDTGVRNKIVQDPLSCLEGSLSGMENRMMAAINENRSVPWIYHPEGDLPWKLRRFDKIIISGQTAENMNRVLSGDKPLHKSVMQ